MVSINDTARMEKIMRTVSESMVKLSALMAEVVAEGQAGRDHVAGGRWE